MDEDLNPRIEQKHGSDSSKTNKDELAKENDAQQQDEDNDKKMDDGIPLDFVICSSSMCEARIPSDASECSARGQDVIQIEEKKSEGNHLPVRRRRVRPMSSVLLSHATRVYLRMILSVVFADKMYGRPKNRCRRNPTPLPIPILPLLLSPPPPPRPRPLPPPLLPIPLHHVLLVHEGLLDLGAQRGQRRS